MKQNTKEMFKDVWLIEKNIALTILETSFIHNITKDTTWITQENIILNAYATVVFRITL